MFAVLARCGAGALEGPRGERLVERADLAGERSHLSGVIPADGVITGGERIAPHPRSKPAGLTAGVCACFKQGDDDLLKDGMRLGLRKGSDQG